MRQKVNLGLIQQILFVVNRGHSLWTYLEMSLTANSNVLVIRGLKTMCMGYHELKILQHFFYYLAK